MKRFATELAGEEINPGRDRARRGLAALSDPLLIDGSMTPSRAEELRPDGDTGNDRTDEQTCLAQQRPSGNRCMDSDSGLLLLSIRTPFGAISDDARAV
jgi:hypothetical protein